MLRLSVLLLAAALLQSAGCGRTSLLGIPADGGPKRKDGGSEPAAEGGDAAASTAGDAPVTRDAGAQVSPDGNITTVEDRGKLRLLAGSPGGPGHVDGTGTSARFRSPHGMTFEGANLFVTDSYDNTLRRVVVASGEVTTLAGLSDIHGSDDGTGSAARFYYPNGVASDGAGHLFVADTNNNTIRKVVIATGEVTTLAGAAMQFGQADGTGDAARFYLPAGIASDRAGHLFIADTFNHTIRQVVIATGKVTTLAGRPGETGTSDGSGAAARFFYPTDIASDGADNLFIADSHGETIRKLVVATGAVTTFAGAPGQPGSTDGDRRAARFDGLHGMLSDGAGHLFIADSENRTVRELEVATGLVRLFAGSIGKAGSDDGTGPAARFGYPFGLARDQGGTLFIADAESVRAAAMTTGQVTTLAGSAEHAGSQDGIGAAALFKQPMGIADDGAGHVLVADSANHCLRQIHLATAEATTLAGSPGEKGSQDGNASAARFSSPTGVASDGAGHVLVADSENHTVRRVDLATGEVSTLAGSPGQEGSQDGQGAAARFSRPQDVVCDHAGNAFVSDSNQHTIRKIVLGTAAVSTLAGTPGAFGSADGIGPAARFDMPHGLALDRAGHLFVADFGNATIRQVVIATGQVTTLAGTPQLAGSADGPGKSALFALPIGLACDGANLFVADADNHAVRTIALGTGMVSTVIGRLGRPGLLFGPLPAGLNTPSGLALDPTGGLTIADTKENAILRAAF